ncbi:DUF4390 domain-containing protein [Natronospira bacteriovora]|uniref:DUF4390 domain-containing protein n=1 Tax=Natronospira bacteriovora TaxID=3069753 RepID=A0ABU0WA35_9GAMM|nr:DUF4390 domain-containing protein [Natronospira sp. AB-CW4]MDQ2070899.1 DUF4390 domain-containing protein [Natronospira sp. AB-CW4]
MGKSTTSCWPGRAGQWLLGLVALFWMAGLSAGSITLITGFTEEVDGIHYLNADIDYRLNEAALSALESGLPLRLSIEVEVRRPRWYWANAVETRFERHHIIQFQPLTRLYVIENEQTGRRKSFQSYGAAIAELGRIEDLPVIEESALDPDTRYDLRMRVSMEVRERPDGLGIIARLWTNSSISSGWYQWTLRS